MSSTCNKNKLRGQKENKNLENYMLYKIFINNAAAKQ